MKLFDATLSPNARKVRVLARELGIDLELVPVVPFTKRSPDHLAHNPVGKVPTLVDDDFALWESGAILVYLADSKPQSNLFPAERRMRADVLRWLFFTASHVQPWMSVLGQERMLKAREGKAPDAILIAHAERELARFLPVLDAQLAGRDYLAGDFTIADIAAGCGFEGAELRGVDLGPFPNLNAWRERLRARPSWADSAA